MKRTMVADTAEMAGKEVVVKGWVNARRDHGKLIFIDLRDQSGLMQVVFWGGGDADLFKQAEGLRSEFVVEIHGKVQERQPNQVNEDIPTGKVELAAEKLIILNEAATPPFEITADTAEVREDVRLKYRYLDLRTERMQRNLRIRSQFIKEIREYLFKNDFTEIETPLLTESTPEGSRDFVVPSRLHPGSFYALPQSPQQYKQLLVTAGFEKYFQIARAIRDEDPRADRGFEHSQVDIEMAFVEQEDVMKTVEEMMITAVEALGYKVKEKPFPRFTYAEAQEKFGADKFDLRTDEEKTDGKTLAYAWVYKFPFFEKTEDGGWTFTHNPFSMPLPESIDDLKSGKNIENILTTQYDLVCNGYESGGGS
jgi:aspartyl-tRNA synthetase